MKKLLNLVASLFLISTSSLSVVACGNNKTDVIQTGDIVQAQVNGQDASKIIVNMKKGIKWNNLLFKGIKYNGFLLSKVELNKVFSIHAQNDVVTITLNFKVMSQDKIEIVYDNSNYQVSINNVHTSWSKNDQQVIKQVNSLVKTGFNFASFYSADQITENSQQFIKAKDSILSNIKNSSDYNIKNFSSDKKYFTPIKIVTNKDKTKSYRQKGSYEFIIYNNKEKEYIGDFPYKISLNIEQSKTSQISNYINGMDDFNNTFGNLELGQLQNILADMGAVIPSKYDNIIQTVLKGMELNFSSTVNNLLNSKYIKTIVDYFLKNQKGISQILSSNGYFDLSKLLDTSKSVYQDKDGNKYYDINSQVRNVISQVMKLLKTVINSDHFHFSIKLPSSAGPLTINNGVINIDLNIQALVYSLLPDLLHCINFIHEQYSKGNHNLPLLIIQYLASPIISNSTDNNKIVKTTSYATDNFDLINHHYEGDNLKSNIINPKMKNVITNNIENLIFDVLSYKNNNGTYTSWSIANENADQYVYLYNQTSGKKQNVYGFSLGVNIDKISYSKIDIPLLGPLSLGPINFDSLTFNSIWNHVGVIVYSLRGYIFNNLFNEVLSTKALLNPDHSIFLTPLLSLFSGEPNLSKDSDFPIKVSTNFSFPIYIFTSNKTITIPDFSPKVTINKKVPDDFVFNAFKNSLFENNNQKVVSTDLLNSFTRYSAMSGNISWEYKDFKSGKWVTIGSSNISNVLKAGIAQDFRIKFSNIKFNLISSFQGVKPIPVAIKSLTFSLDNDIPLFDSK